jgi:hypothetical protein
MVPQPKKRKKIRTLQHRGTIGSGASLASRLSPHLSNIDKLRQSSNISPVISSAASSERRHVRLGQDAGTITATPGGNTVSDITIGASDQFNAFRVNEKSSLESYKQTMSFKLKDDIFRKLKFVTSHSMMEFSMDPNSLCQYICKEMHITGTQQGAFWTAVKDTVKRMIEKQRTNATSGCKKAFQGKFNRNLSVDTSMTA